MALFGHWELYCSNCGTTFLAQDGFMRCPRCGSTCSSTWVSFP